MAPIVKPSGRRSSIDVIGSLAPSTPRHVFNNDIGISRNMLAQKSNDRPYAQVRSAAGICRRNDVYVLVLVKGNFGQTKDWPRESRISKPMSKTRVQVALRIFLLCIFSLFRNSRAGIWEVLVLRSCSFAGF